MNKKLKKIEIWTFKFSGVEALKVFIIENLGF